jgi:hypothetical protein
MAWTKEKLEQIPEVYRDFLMVLKPIVDSRKPGTILRTTGIPFGMIYGKLTERHEDYTPEKVRQLAENLRKQNYIIEDDLGFFQPAPKGEQVIEAIAGAETMNSVPALPEV